jgi:hypothetical protein
MAAISSVKKLGNEMKLLEEQSDRCIPSDHYYIICLCVEEPREGTEDLLERWSQDILTLNPEHRPLVSYHFQNTVCTMYSCLEEDQTHYLEGRQSSLISEYVSLLSRFVKSRVRCHIIEFEYRTQVISYFLWKIHTNSKECLRSQSDGTISAQDIQNKTFGELTSKLQEETEVKWSDIPKSSRYGTFYKLKKKKGNVFISSLSEVFDARDVKKYTSFVFE